MPAADLPALEQRLEACLIELERLYEARPRMSDALARAGAGQTKFLGGVGGIRPHGGMGRHVVAVLLNEEVGGAVARNA